MADIIFIAITIAFFVLCVLYVHWCDRIIGPDELESTTPSTGDRDAVFEEVAA